MTPFQSVRLWIRRAPLLERVGALVAGAVAITAVTWLVAPSGGRAPAVAAASVAQGPAGVPAGAVVGTTGAPGAAGTGSGGSAGGTAAGSAGAGSAGVTGAGARGPVGPAQASTAAAPAPVSPGASTTSAKSCTSPPGTDQGVSATQMKIAVVLIDLGASLGNQEFGLPSSQVQQQDYQAVIDSINASGGIACRRVAATFYPADPADQSNLQETCLNIEQAGVFAVLDLNAFDSFPSLAECFPANHLPYISPIQAPAAELRQNYPYMFSTESDVDLLHHDTIFGLAQQGFFNPAHGFAKLGFIYRSCSSDEVSEVHGWLAQVGAPAPAVVDYDLGCPSALASPQDLEQAILKFQENGVTHVTEVHDEGDFGTFTKLAAQQRFFPRYGIPQDGVVPISSTAEGPAPAEMVGALAITGDRYGEEQTPGYRPSAGTARCDAIFAAHGGQPVYQQPSGVGGNACDQLWLLAAAADHAPSLQRGALASGLAAAGSIDFSYPMGPNQFGAGVTNGGQYWRADQWGAGCSCWQVPDPTFEQNFGGT